MSIICRFAFRSFAICFIGLIAVLFPASGTGQNTTFEWVRTFGGSSQEHAVSITMDADKYIVTAGNFSQTVDFDPGPGVFNLTSNVTAGNIYISKLDTGGNFIWAKKIGGSIGDGVKKMAGDVQGNLYLTGFFQGTVDFDPGPAVYNLTATNNVYSFILKLDRDGNFLWAKQLTTPSTQSIAADAVGNVIITGEFIQTVDFDPGPGVFNASSNSAIDHDIFILKLNASGNFTWMKQLHTPAGSLNGAGSVQTDAATNIYVAGIFGNTVDFDPGAGTYSLTSNGAGDIYLMKLSAAGTFIWVKQIGGPQSESGGIIELDQSGKIILAGAFKGSVDFDPGPATYNLTGSSAIYLNAAICKLDESGNFIFAGQFSGATGHVQPTALATDNNDDIYICGSFSGLSGSPFDFDPGPATYNLYKGEIFISKLSNAGNLKWAKALTCLTGSFSYYAGAIKIDSRKNVYSTSSFNGTMDFDPETPVYSVTSAGALDGYVHKLSQCRSANNITATSCGSYTLNGMTYDSTGTYYQTVDNLSGCDSIITLYLTVTKQKTTVNATVCFGAAYGLYNSSGTYIDTFQTLAGCDSIRTLNLTVNNEVSVNLGADTGVCSGGTVLLNAGNFATYLWNNNTSANQLPVTAPGIYWVKVTDNNNCPGSDSINVLPGVPPSLKVTKSSDISCVSAPVLLTASGADTYEWFPAAGLNGSMGQTVTVMPGATTQYFVKGKNTNGCEKTDSITVFVKTDAGGILYMPNSFTPNGDGKNDCYRINYSGSVSSLKFLIYNRWGQEVFFSNSVTDCWDGFYKGKKADAGAYVYYVTGAGACGHFEQKGTVLLIR